MVVLCEKDGLKGALNDLLISKVGKIANHLTLKRLHHQLSGYEFYEAKFIMLEVSPKINVLQCVEEKKNCK